MMKFVLTKGMLFILAIASIIVILIQGAVAGYIEANRTKQSMTCSFVSYATSSDYVAMIIKCGDKARTITSAKVIVSHLKNPGDLTCRVSNVGLHDCDELK